MYIYVLYNAYDTFDIPLIIFRSLKACRDYIMEHVPIEEVKDYWVEKKYLDFDCDIMVCSWDCLETYHIDPDTYELNI
jgi:hypothetical protein